METVIQSNGKIAGTRISVYDVYYYLVNDWQPKDIGPILQLSPEQIQSAIQYIEEHREAVRAVHNEIEERNAHGNPPEVEPKLAKSREKMQAWLRERHQAKSQEREVMGLRKPGTEIFGEFGLKITVDHRPAKRGGKNRFWLHVRQDDAKKWRTAKTLSYERSVDILFEEA